MKDFESAIQYKGKTYKMVFNLNVMETVQKEYGTLGRWGELSDGGNGEPDAKAVIFGFTEMINEGIDISNEENGTNEPFMTHKQVGRMITEIGLSNAARQMNNVVIESTKSEEKNG